MIGLIVAASISFTLPYMTAGDIVGEPLEDRGIATGRSKEEKVACHLR